MTTLATLKAEIADDITRSDLTDAIAAAITAAIKYFQTKRFYFNETRDLTFSTVIGQSRYATVDDADIPKFITLDGVFATINGQNRQLRPMRVQEFEVLNDNSASTGEPYSYCYYNIGFGLYPIPGAVYTIRPIGHVLIDAPADDTEAGNAWMTEAYQLIRRRAAADVLLTKVRDFEFAQAMAMAADTEFSRLEADTSKRIATGQIQATSF